MIPASAAGSSTNTGSNGWITIYSNQGSRNQETGSRGFADVFPKPEIEEEPDLIFKPYWAHWIEYFLDYLFDLPPDPLPVSQTRSIKSPLLRLLRHTLEPLAR